MLSDTLLSLELQSKVYNSMRGLGGTRSLFPKDSVNQTQGIYCEYPGSQESLLQKAMAGGGEDCHCFSNISITPHLGPALQSQYVLLF